MTETQKIDLKTAKAAVESIAQAYKEKSELVLDPDSIGENLLDRMPSPTGWRLLILPYRGRVRRRVGFTFQTTLLKKTRYLLK